MNLEDSKLSNENDSSKIGKNDSHNEKSCSSPSSSSSSVQRTDSLEGSISEKNDSQYPYQISPSTIPGVLHAQNFGAIDWSINGLIAYGCRNQVVIVDTNPSMCFHQTLHRHKHTVCLVKWSPRNKTLCLCSIDTSGVIIVWNILESTPLTVILSTNETKSVNFIHWIYLEPETNCLLNESFSETLSQLSDKYVQSSNLINCDLTTVLSTATNHYLLTFYQSTNTFIVYDADRGEPTCKWQVDFFVSQIAYNPFFTFNRSCDFTVSNLLLGFKSSSTKDDNIYLALARINESNFINTSLSMKEPKKIHDVFMQIYSVQSSSNSQNEPISNSTTSLKNINKLKRYDLITRLSSDKSELSKILVSLSENHSSNNSANNANFNQISNNLFSDQYVHFEFHKSIRNQIFIIFLREIYLLDLSLQTIITVIPMERNCSKLTRIFSCSHRNAFFACHESGNISFRLYQKKLIQDNLMTGSVTKSMLNSYKLSDQTSTTSFLENDAINEDSNIFLSVAYINLCHSEPIRLTKQNRIFGYSISPFDETKICILLSSGRIIIKSLICQKLIQEKTLSSPNSLDHVHVVVNQRIAKACLNDLIKAQEYKLGAFLVNNNLDDQQIAMDSIFYKIIITHYLNGLNSLPSVIRMCPPLTLKNINKHKPYLAVGDTLGILQIWLLNNNSSSLHREFSVHSYAIAGIEWTGLTSLISFSYPTMNSPSQNALSALSNFTGSGSSSGKVTNELIYLDIENGKITPFRTNHINDSSPIEAIRVSHLKQYLIILFKQDDPFEIWDVQTLTLLKVMSKTMNHVTAVEWSPLYNRKQALKNIELSDSEQMNKAPIIAVKENFIVTSRELYHYSIEGNIVRELAKIPPDAETGNVNVTSIAWKSDQVLLGDASGTLNVWDLKRKVSRTEATYRSSIKKIRFGPGRGNMKCAILYLDFGVDIWDINEFRVCSQLKYPRDIGFKIIDVDWASCDLPIFCTTDGLIYITDSKLKVYSSPINIDRLSCSSNVSQLLNNKCFNIQQFMLSSSFSSSFLENQKSTLIDINWIFLTENLRIELIRKFIFEIPLVEDLSKETTNQSENCNTTNLDLKQYIKQQMILAKIFNNLDDLEFWQIVSSILLGEEIDFHLDLFLDNNQFRSAQQERLMLLELNRKTYFHVQQAYKLNLNLRNFQRAVQILLETESFVANQQHWDNRLNDDQQTSTNNRAFYIDALKACLIAALQTEFGKNNMNREPNKMATEDSVDHCYSLTDNFEDATSQADDNNDSNNNVDLFNETKVAPVVKLVATTLVANGFIAEGVELLNFISKTLDSCKYLQSSDKWLDSIWLAKSSLNNNECTEILRRWCDHLISSKRNSDLQTALKIYLSRKQFSRLLRTMNRFSELKAFPFAICLCGAQLIDIEANRDILEEIFDKFVSFFYDYNSSTLAQIKAKHSNKTKNDADETGENPAKNDVDSNLITSWSLFSRTNVPIY